MIRDFYIKTGSTLPILVMKVIKNVHNKDIVDEMFSNVTDVTFTMKGEGCDEYKIYNKKAEVITKEEECVDCIDKKKQYYLIYKFTEKQTSNEGVFNAEFTVNMDGTENYSKGKYKLPLKYDIKVRII